MEPNVVSDRRMSLVQQPTPVGEDGCEDCCEDRVGGVLSAVARLAREVSGWGMDKQTSVFVQQRLPFANLLLPSSSAIIVPHPKSRPLLTTRRRTAGYRRARPLTY